MGNPFLTYAGLMERTAQYIHLFLHNDPMVLGYALYRQFSIDGAYGNPAGSGVGGSGAVAMAPVLRGNTYRSPGLIRRGLGLVEENRRGTTHIIVDPVEFVAGGLGLPPVPVDQLWLYMRMQEQRAGGFLGMPGPLPVLGPICCIPPARAMGLPKPTFTATGTAPSAAVGVAAGAVPPFDEDLTTAAPRPLHIVFPYPLEGFTLRNLDGVKALLVSFGPGQLMQSIPAGGEVQLFSGSTKALILATAAAGGCPYSIHGVLGRG